MNNVSTSGDLTGLNSHTLNSQKTKQTNKRVSTCCEDDPPLNNTGAS